MDYKKRMDRIENKITAAGGVKYVWLECYDADGNYIKPPPPEPGEIRIDLTRIWETPDVEPTPSAALV